MAATVFFLGALIALISAAFMYANQENQQSREAMKQVEATLQRIDRLNAKVLVLEQGQINSDSELKGALDRLLSGQDDKSTKLSQKVEWLEMKVNSSKPPALPHKVTLIQEKPLRINLVYKESRRQEVGMSPKSKHELILKSTKKKIEELSK